MVEVTLPVILQLVQTVGVLTGIVYYITIMRNQQKNNELTQKAQLEAEKTRKKEMIILRSQSYSLDYTTAFFGASQLRDWKTPEEFYSKYSMAVNPDAFSKQMYIRSVFNMAGLLLKESDVDPKLIFDMYSPVSVVQLWEQYEPLIQEARVRFNYPDMWEPFEFLYNEARRLYPDVSYPVDISPNLAKP